MLKGRRQRHPPARLQFSHGGSPSSHAACARAWHAFVNLLRNARQTCATTAVRACAHGLGPWANGAKQSPPRKLSAALSPSPSVEPISVDPVSALRSALSASTYPNRERRADQTASCVIARSSMSASTPAAVVPVPAPAPRSTNGVCEYQPAHMRGSTCESGEERTSNQGLLGGRCVGNDGSSMHGSWRRGSRAGSRG